MHDGKIRVDSLQESCHLSWKKDAMMLSSHVSVLFKKDVVCRSDIVFEKMSDVQSKRILQQISVTY